ncbi:WD domain, G-beta repeat-containing protein [Besnoitia besnoiti]|uniref:WD domain, G-beta repeat-containing protein n=1 Tax=Besnoitia besnoiti TaxID=94643 RepID=A0A2A9MCJ3_BESBE|nr:WD domain, G-beta repeat-containing protein [Besnoitia besnoiti]PFH36208.1 WD domain, G-beta repeat-containing protein [Besnoitia besnoiti]
MLSSDLSPLPGSPGSEPPYGSATTVACCTYKLDAPTAATLVALPSPDAYASFCRSASASSLLPHLFLAGTTAADQQSNQLHVLGYAEETCEVECSARLRHAPEIHALALLPASSVAPDAAASDEQQSSEGMGEEEEKCPTGSLAFFTAFPDRSTRFATDRCVLWRSPAVFPSPAGSLLDCGEKDEMVREASQPAELQPVQVAELASGSNKRFSPIRKLVSPRGDDRGFEESGREGEELLVLMDDCFEVFQRTEASYDSVSEILAEPQHRFCSAAFAFNEPHTVAAVTAREDSLGGACVYGSGGRLQIFDLRASTRAVASAVNPHGAFAAPLAIDSNPNLSFSLVSGASDGSVAFWDWRMLHHPAILRDIHSHWVTSVAFNAFHDQLLLTASTDSTVKLHHAEPLAVGRSLPPRAGGVSSSGVKRDNGSIEGDDTHAADAGAGDGGRQREKREETSHELISTYEGSEDSVAAVAWASDDAWVFAALTAEGRVSFHQVPPKEKYRILL